MTPEQREERFEKFASVLIATVTILAAITAFLQAYASNEADRADRQAQDFSIRATTTRVNGALEFSYDWQGAFQTWRELDLQAASAEQEGDALAAERFRRLQDHIASLSPLLNPPYFDEQQNWPDPARYEAELYLVEATRLAEHFAAQAELSNAWSNIANVFVIQLTLLTVALSLYGLSTTIRGMVRWLFVGVGSAIVAFNLGWMAVMLIVELPELPAEAIDAYAQGVGMAYQGRDAEAIALFDQALAIQPDYANALYERGNAYFFLGDYQQAVADYQAAREAGRNDVTVGWDLGWTYYLLGQFDQAVLVNAQVLALDPTLIGIRMNQGLALLAQGRFDNAQLEYQQALDEAVRQVNQARSTGQQPPASLWYYLDAGAADLESLLDQINGTPKPWTQAPPPDLVQADFARLQAFAQEHIKRIKEMTVALEFTGQPPPGPGNANVSAFRFGQEIYDQQGNLVRFDEYQTFEYGVDEIAIWFDFTGIPPGAQEVWKIYRNGFEDQSLRTVSEWALESSGKGVKYITYAYSNIFIFAPGEYTVELYIDQQLVQRGSFTVAGP